MTNLSRVSKIVGIVIIFLYYLVVETISFGIPFDIYIYFIHGVLNFFGKLVLKSTIPFKCASNKSRLI